MKFKQASFYFILLASIFLTSSFDIFLQLKTFGYTVRFSYLLAFILIISSFPRKLKFLGLWYFLIWTFFLCLFVFNTSLLGRNVGYLLWHFLHFFLIISIVNIVDNEQKFIGLFKIYLFSFAFIAYLGLAQFFLGVLGFDFYVEQWWIENKLPRVNGFSYEPSYFATYLIIGWTMFFVLIVQQSSIIRRLLMKFCFFIISLALLLSSSRLGIFFMGAVIVAFSFWVMTKSFLTLSIPRSYIYFLCFSLLLFFGAFVYAVPLVISKYSFLLDGTGLAGRAAHSTVRFETMSNMVAIILKEPFVGTSLGGIPSAIAKQSGLEIKSIVEAKDFEGINVFLEVFVASGLVGFCFFFMFLTKLIMSSFSLLRAKVFSAEIVAISAALLFSFIVELSILCFNQNILRIYVWLHIAMINAYYFTYLSKKRSQDEAL